MKKMEITSMLNTSILNTTDTSIENTVADKRRLCIILDQFCKTLIDFAICVKEPTLNINKRIKYKKLRTTRFDTYISTIENFNNVMKEVLDSLGNVILSLKLLLINKEIHSLQNFINNLVLFLALLKENDVFNRLIVAKLHLNNMQNKDIKSTELLKKLNNVIYKVCSIGLEVTSLIIPGLGIAKEVADILNTHIDENLTEDINSLHKTHIQLDNVIKTLIDIRKQGSDLTIILDVNTNNIIKCLNDKNAEELNLISRNLELEYVYLAHLILNTEGEIIIYKGKKKNFIADIFNSLLA